MRQRNNRKHIACAEDPGANLTPHIAATKSRRGGGGVFDAAIARAELAADFAAQHGPVRSLMVSGQPGPDAKGAK